MDSTTVGSWENVEVFNGANWLAPTKSKSPVALTIGTNMIFSQSDGT